MSLFLIPDMINEVKEFVNTINPYTDAQNHAPSFWQNATLPGKTLMVGIVIILLIIAIGSLFNINLNK